MNNLFIDAAEKIANLREVMFISYRFLDNYYENYVLFNTSGRYADGSSIGSGKNLTPLEQDALLKDNRDIHLVTGDKTKFSAFELCSHTPNAAKRACKALIKVLHDIFDISCKNLVAHQNGTSSIILSVIWSKALVTDELYCFGDSVVNLTSAELNRLKCNATVRHLTIKGGYVPLPFFINSKTGEQRRPLTLDTFSSVSDLIKYSGLHSPMDDELTQKALDIACGKRLPENKSTSAYSLKNEAVVSDHSYECSIPAFISIDKAELLFIAGLPSPSQRRLFFAMLLCLKTYGRNGKVRITYQALSRLCGIAEVTVRKSIYSLCNSVYLMPCSKDEYIPFVECNDNIKSRGTLPGGYYIGENASEKIKTLRQRYSTTHKLMSYKVIDALRDLDNTAFEAFYKEVIDSIFSDETNIRNQKLFSDMQLHAINERRW